MRKFPLICFDWILILAFDSPASFTVIQAFNRTLSELGDVAGQHETISEELSLNIVKEIQTLLKELKDERKRHLAEGTRLQAQYHAGVLALDKSKRVYEKAFREAEKAHENLQKADADLNLSRAEVGKAKQIWTSKTHIAEDSKLEYANQLQQTNDLQRRHFHELMPKVFRQLQDMEERREQCIQNYIQQSAHIRRKVIPLIEKCIDGMIDASQLIHPERDSQLVIEKFKSGVYPPEDFPFEDLSNPRLSDSDSASVNGGGSGGGMDLSGSSSTLGSASKANGSTSLHYSKSDTFRGTFSAAKFKKRGGLLSIFSGNKVSLFLEKFLNSTS